MSLDEASTIDTPDLETELKIMRFENWRYEDMKISFLVTYYNQREYVEQSIESILHVKKPCEWEILIGDDGSTDGTIQIAQEYVKRYPENIRLYVMPRDTNKKYDSVKRASANRLNILEHATGDIFCTLDGDDYYCDSDFVEDAITVFEREESVSVVTFGYRFVTDGIEEKGRMLPAKLSGIIDKREYLTNFYIHAGACVYRKNWDKERIEYIREIGYFDDNDIVINNLNFGEMYAINRVIYAYRQTGNGIYTSMNRLEQAILNVQGMDVDLKLIENMYRNDIINRYAESILTVFVWRRFVKNVLGEEKYLRYLKGCKEIEDSLGYRLLTFEKLPSVEKRKTQLIMNDIKKQNKKQLIKVYIKYALRGLLK